MIRPAHASLAAALFAGACAVAPVPPSAPLAGARPDPAPFSTAVTLDALPPGWVPFRFARFKKPTDYRLVAHEGTVALEATADSSASGLRFDTVADVAEYPWLSWRWKVPALNGKADNTLAHVEDSPARVIVIFEGGREELPEDERMNYDLAKAMGGHGLPYATLMYIWENRLPEGAIITHHFTTRVKMIVAGNGKRDLGEWHEERVNLLEDYRRAFGEEPPRVRAVGIMSDSDNTGERTVAYYGDIRFGRR
ncbi:MAG: DUF3047 domain-containing protein [Betaproteobacteria bacterium]|nr:DUF3047 domain-containing protein [Betaproteobacteria bacterium]